MSGTTNVADETYRYDVFLSYKHDDGGVLASALRRGLERIAQPWYRRRGLAVFLDRVNLDACPDGWARIQTALRDSKWLVLVATPNAATSPWVAREVEYWISLGRADRLMIAHGGGRLRWRSEPNGTGLPQDWDWEVTDSIPPCLSGAFAAVPFWVNLTSLPRASDRTLRNPLFLEPVAKLAAPIKKVSTESLLSDDVRNHRRAVRLAWGVGGTLLALLAAVGLLFFRLRVTAAERSAEQEQKKAAIAESDRRQGEVVLKNEQLKRAEAEDRAKQVALDAEKQAKLRQEALESLARAEADALRGDAAGALAATARAHATDEHEAPLPVLVRRWLDADPLDWEAPCAFLALDDDAQWVDDGRVVLSLVEERAIAAYRGRDGALLGVYEPPGHEGEPLSPIQAFVASKSGSHLLVRHEDSSRTLFHAESGEAVGRWVDPDGESGFRASAEGGSMAVSADGALVAWIAGGSVHSASPGAESRRRATKGDFETGAEIAFSDDGTHVLAVDVAGRWARWRLPEWELEREGEAKEAEPRRLRPRTDGNQPAPFPRETAPRQRPLVAIARGGSSAAWLSRTGQLRVLDAKAIDWLPLALPKPAPAADPDIWSSLAVADHGVLLTSWMGEEVVRVAWPEDAVTVARPDLGTAPRGLGEGEAFSGRVVPLPSGLDLVHGIAHPWIERVDLSSRRRATLGGATDAPCSSVRFAADGRTVIAGDSAGVLRTFDAGTGRSHEVVAAHAHGIVFVGVRPDGSVVSVAADGEITLRAARGLAVVASARQAGATSAGLSADGKRVAVASPPPQAKTPAAAVRSQGVVYELPSLTVVGTLQLTLGPASCVAVGTSRVFASNVAEVGWAEPGGTFRSRGIEVARLRDGIIPGEGGTRLALSPDGDVLFVGDDSGRVRAWRADDLAFLREVRAFERPVGDLALTGDGTRLIAAGGGVRLGGSSQFDGPSILVLDTRSLETLARIHGAGASWRSIALSADGTAYAGATVDRRVRGGTLSVGGRASLPLDGAANSTVASVLPGGILIGVDRANPFLASTQAAAPERRWARALGRGRAIELAAGPVGPLGRDPDDPIVDELGVRLLLDTGTGGARRWTVRDAVTGETVRSIDVAAVAWSGKIDDLKAPSLSRKGTHVLACGKNAQRQGTRPAGVVALLRFDVASGKAEWWKTPPYVTAWDWDRTGTSAFVLDRDGAVHRITASAAILLGKLTDVEDIDSIAVGSDGAVLVVRRRRAASEVIDVPTWIKRCDLKGIYEEVVSDDARFAFGVGPRSAARVLSLDDGTALVDLPFASDGRGLAGVVDRAAMRVWRLPRSVEPRVDRYDVRVAAEIGDVLRRASASDRAAWAEESGYTATRRALEAFATVESDARVGAAFRIPEPSSLHARVEAVLLRELAREVDERATRIAGLPGDARDARREQEDLLRRLAVEGGSPTDRLRWAERAAALDEASAPAWNALGYARSAAAGAYGATPGADRATWRGMVDGALEAYRRGEAVAKTPVERAGALRGQASVLTDLGRYTEVLERLHAAAALGYEHLTADVWFVLANHEWSRGDFDAVVRVTTGAVAALGLPPESPLAVFGRSASLVRDVMPSLTRLPAVVITTVPPDGAAARAGLAVGDSLRSVDGEEIESSVHGIDSFRRLLARPTAGASPSAKVEVERAGKRIQLEIALPSDGLDAVVVNAPARLLLYVTQRFSGTPAARADVRGGDYIWRVGDEVPTSLDELAAALPKAGEVPKKIVFRRFVGTAERGFRLRRDARGEPARDAAGAASWDFTEFALEAPPGELLGVVVGPAWYSEPVWR